MLEKYLWFVATNRFTVIVTLILVMIILNYCTWKLESEISTIGKKLKISPSVRWAVFDASMSSLPELLTAFAWLMMLGNAWLEVWIWTIWWSALFNILIIPAAVLLVYRWKEKIKIEKSWIRRDSLFFIFSVIVFLLWLYFNQLLYMSIWLIITYILYIIYLYIESLKHRKVNQEEVMEAYKEVEGKKINYIIIILALFFIYVMVEASVVAAERIGHKLNISVMIISLVVLAAITSIPDTLLSIKSSQKWEVNAWLSNAVGSNIFDICIWLWVPIFIGISFMGLNPQVNFKENISLFIFVILSVFVYYIILNIKKISRKHSSVFLFLYIFTVLFLVLN